ncbi:isoaspartyl peptidase/L-asparaginase family protein [Pseudopedobacter saltans]|nr:isoaspartyl peptidase/L-asparaginase [Pseudopedobacter saltans]
MENKIAIAIHGGAGEDSEFIRRNLGVYKAGLREAVLAGYKILQNRGTALDAVTAAVVSMEDNYLFNAGKGSALNIEGNVAMDAAVMDGKDIRAGAIALLSHAKNPVEVAKAVMVQTNHVLLAGEAADDFAESMKLPQKEQSYFKTEHQQEEYEKAKADSVSQALKKKNRGTVGAVALDGYGNLAAATSTGGMPGKLAGRLGDSCIIGAGCYANNHTCAVSGTGDGELLITHVIAHSIAMVVELKGLSLQQACDYVVHKKNAEIEGDIGVVSVDRNGNIGMAFNSERMHRAWMDRNGNVQSEIY